VVDISGSVLEDFTIDIIAAIERENVDIALA
jgi:hypothetical protein